MNLRCTLVLVPAVLFAAAPDSLASPRRNIEWIGVNLGGGAAFFSSNPTPHPTSDAIQVSRFVPQVDLLLFNLHWPYLYLTALEAHPMFGIGFLGGGTRAGMRLPLTSDHRHELRAGAFVGVDAFLYHINAYHPALSIKPHVQYVYNTRSGSIGVGVDVPLNLHFRDTMTGGDGHTFSVPPLMTGVMAHLRWTLLRSPL